MNVSLSESFAARFGHAPAVRTRAPGRLEILGNHTDYNEGVVLSVAVDRETQVAAGPAAGGECVIEDVRDGDSRRFRADDLRTPQPGDWANYIKGLVVELAGRGIRVPAFEAVFASTVPLSAGMSSSAALEMSFALALGRLAGVELPWVEWARIGQACENNYVGARTGLLDQFSSLKGRAGHLVFSDFRSLDVRNVPLPGGVALVVANSMVKHHLTGAYNERRARCEDAVAVLHRRHPEVRALRDVDSAALEAAQPEMDVTSYRRARHVVGENERVFAGVAALERGDLAAFGRLMFESHESSRRFFENSCPELDQLVEVGRSLPGCIGARLSGGGFGGITVHLVVEAEAESYARRLQTAYRSLAGTAPDVMVCHAANGAEVLPE
ncbi:MAG: Galactokinase [Lentisphaerae bacterium ADurb.BinA184]|nr:MAG: Galactokinase [Lentisphaerae bacterium ADurb.BinA184]